MVTIETFDTKHREIIDGFAQYLCERGGVDWSFSGAKYRWRQDAEQILHTIRDNGPNGIDVGMMGYGVALVLAAANADKDEFLRDPVAYNEAHP